MDFLVSLRRQTLILALCYILIGIFFVACPGTAAETIVRLIAAAALVFGIVQIAAFFSSRKYDEPFRNSLASGTVVSALAVFMLARPQVIVSIVYVIIGAALIVGGILTVQGTLDLWHYRERKNVLPLLLGLLTLLLGVVVLFNPFPTAKALMRISGIFLIVGGAADFIVLAYMIGISNSFVKKE